MKQVTVKTLREALAKLPDDLPIMMGWELGYHALFQLPERLTLWHEIDVYGTDNWGKSRDDDSTGRTLDAVILF